MRHTLWLVLAGLVSSGAAFGQDRPAVAQEKPASSKPGSAVPQ
jgi:hypothetical protein